MFIWLQERCVNRVCRWVVKGRDGGGEAVLPGVVLSVISSPTAALFGAVVTHYTAIMRTLLTV